MYQSLFLDLETIPCERQDVRDYLAEKICKETQDKLLNVKAPSNYKDEVKIVEYINSATRALLDGEASAIDDAVNKTGLDGAFGRVCCIGYVLDEADEPEAIYGLDEPVILNQFNEALNTIPASMWSATTVVGHNLIAFDIRFLIQRYIVNSIRPHPIISMAARAKPWEQEKCFDTMTQFAGVGHRISLDKLCLALGLEGKGDITGADVWPMVQAGRIKDVAEYCKHDVLITRAVFKRMTFAQD